MFESPHATLFKLTQTGSLNDYYMTFTSLANRVSSLTPDAMMDCFISGLQPVQRGTFPNPSYFN